MDATLILPVLKQDHMKRPDMDHSNRCTIHTMVFMVIQVERRDTRGDEIPEALRAGFSDVIEVAQHSYIVMAAKNVLAAAAATPSVPAFRAPYCKYTFWIGYVSYGIVLAPWRAAPETWTRLSSMCLRPLLSECGAEDKDEEKKYVASSLLSSWRAVLERQKRRPRAGSAPYCSVLFDGEISLYASIYCSGLFDGNYLCMPAYFA
ncbi:uncharacterized protein [Triticum aestivum]|nr:uncharacterized protein LOC123146184 isoform X2 [Triticum aestivum]XP_044421721.1 uncharacterized protein LOC123146184 isoform X2 [Triticum aestivum]XP_044421722.1 uncharacterized protein LOC123146184 isoform X2 [Triticum aestivum]